MAMEIIEKANDFQNKVAAAKAAEPYMERSRKWADDYGKWRNEWSHVGDFDAPQVDENGNPVAGNAKQRTSTGRRFDELSKLYTGEVDRGMYDAAGDRSREMSRRGMGDSGYSGAAQDGIMMKAAEVRAKAREAARAGAVGEAMQVKMGDLGGLSQQAGVDLAPYQAEFNLYAQERLAQMALDAQNQQMFYQGVGQLGGMGAGALFTKLGGK